MESYVFWIFAVTFILNCLRFDYKKEYQYRNCKRAKKGCRNWLCKANAMCQYSEYQLRKGDKLPAIYNVGEPDGTLYCPVCFKRMAFNGRLFWRRGKAYMVCTRCMTLSDSQMHRMCRKGELLIGRVGHYDYL